MITIPNVPFDPSQLVDCAFYIWVLPDGEHKVVFLNDDHDGLEEYGYPNNDVWFFDDNLVGTLYGPIQLEITHE